MDQQLGNLKGLLDLVATLQNIAPARGGQTWQNERNQSTKQVAVSGSSSEPRTECYKTRLVTRIGKAQGRACGPNKEVVYSTTEVGGTDEARFQSVVRFFDGTVCVGAAASSKKKAEQEAAKVALKEVFQEHIPATQIDGRVQHQQLKVGTATKRKPDPPAWPDHKHTLARNLSLLLGGEGVTKSDLIYSVQGDGNIFTATVTIPSQGNSFEGTPQESRKLAEQAAAEAALKGMSKEFAVVEAKSRTTKKDAPAWPDRKHKLAQSLSFLLGGEGVTKTDLIYSVQEVGKVFMATVTIPSQGKSFEGTPQESRKLAEQAAAEAALAGMSGEFAHAEALAKSKREEKFQAKKKTKLAAET